MASNGRCGCGPMPGKRLSRAMTRTPLASVNLILAMNEFYHGRSDLTEEAIDELDRKAPSLIPDCVCNLNVWTKSREFEGGGTGGSVVYGVLVRHRRSAGFRSQSGPQRAMSVRLGPQIQTLLRRELIAGRAIHFVIKRNRREQKRLD